MSFSKEYYDRIEDPDLQIFLAYKISKLLKWNSSTKVLDIGCGRGWLVKTLNNLSIEAYGVDINEYAINNTVTKNVCLADALNLPFGENCFDSVVSLQTLEHINQIDKAINEVKRVIKPGSIIFLTTPKLNTKSAKDDSTHVNVMSEEEWVRHFNLRRCKWIEDDIIEARAEYLTNKEPSSLIGAILSKAPSIKKKLIEWVFVRENTTLCLEVRK